MADNPGPVLMRALKLPLRDVHDVCATGDIDYLIEFAHDEEKRVNKGLGRAHSASRKATSPVRRAEILQSSKVAEEVRLAEERKELANRARKREENRRRRKAEAEAAAREDGAGAGDGGDGQDSEIDSVEEARRSAEAAAAAADEEAEAEAALSDEEEKLQQAKSKVLLLSTGAGSTDEDKVPCDHVFPRPHLGQTAAAASEDAAFNTVGFGTVSVYDLVNFRDENGFLPIHTACVFGNVEIVDWLMDHGADIESVAGAAAPTSAQSLSSKFRPLHLAVMNKHDTLARRLVETYNADPGALTASFDTPLLLARKIRYSDLELFFKRKCQDCIKSSNALQAAYLGEVLFFAHHLAVDEDHGKKVFTEDYAKFRPTDKAPDQMPGGPAISMDMVMRDPAATPLDVAIAGIGTPASPEHMIITELLLKSKMFPLNELRESPIATTTLYLAVSMPAPREAVTMLIAHGADPRVASVFNAATSQIMKLTLAEAEAKIVFDEYYATRDEVSFEDRSEFVSTVHELRTKWKKAQHTLTKTLDREEAIAAANMSEPAREE